MSASVSRFARSALAIALAATGIAVHAGTPLYHLTPLAVPGSSSVTVQDINDVGQAVGTYSDSGFVRHAVLWDALGWHELALPPSDSEEVDGIARAINNAGQIVGTSDDLIVPTFGLLWTASDPGSYTVLNNDSGNPVSPADINDAGVVAGGHGVPGRAFVWTATNGLVDYGIQDPNVPDQQARWARINASGKLIGVWNQHVSNIHATVGQVGTAVVLGMGGASDEFPTNAVGVNNAGVAVGLGLAEATPNLVPVVFGDDGSYAEIVGATLDQPNGSAIAINDNGVIVGTAGIGTANGPVPGLQAWVYRDGTVYDLYAVVDDTTGFTSFANAVSINASGVIVGTGHDADGNLRSFMLTPIQLEEIFASGFDVQ